jgi:hypothetical protein
LIACAAGPIEAQIPLQAAPPPILIAQAPPLATAAPDSRAPAPTTPPPTPPPPTAPPAPADAAPASPAPADSAPAPLAVQVTSLAQLDLFSAGRDLGLGADLWKGSSAEIAHAVVPTLGRGPLSPAAASFAQRLLAQAARAPDGAGGDVELAGDRVHALLALGDAATVDSIADRTAGLPDKPGLSQAAAEAALITDQNAKACAIGDALAVDRDKIYWLRLRAFCQVLAGKPDAAQLTFTLANQEGKDAVYARLMGSLIAGAGDPGAPALRNGLDYALSRQLKLDLEPALPQATPAIAAHLAASIPPPPPPPPDASASASPPPAAGSEADLLAVLRKADTPAGYLAASKNVAPNIAILARDKAIALADPVQLATAAAAAGDLATAQLIRGALTQDATPGASPTDLAVLDALLAVAAGKPDAPTLDRLAERGVEGAGKEKARAQAAAVLFAVLGGPIGDTARAEMVDFDLGRAEAWPARLMVMDASADAGLRGETGLLALSIAELGGAAGPKPADRASIVRALTRAGLSADARAFALEGLIALQSR